MTEKLSNHPVSIASKVLSYVMVSSVFLYLLNNYLVYWQDFSGPYHLFEHFGWYGNDSVELSDEQIQQSGYLVSGYLIILLFSIFYSIRIASTSLRVESARLQTFAAYFVRAAFWAVMLIGFADMLISFLRIENFLGFWLSDDLLAQLGRPSFRGTYIHYPLLLSAFVFALIFRHISFSWLALMVVLAEFQIVLTRFVFSYEQAFQGDLVRFWYAALFLFASAYTLINDGHVRVDVLYAGFSRQKKAFSNIFGSLFLGLPLCWVILMHGMGGKGNSINAPLLSFEISQSGYGMYVKYLMAGFLVVFAVSMIIQFCSYFLLNVATIMQPLDSDDESQDDAELPVDIDMNLQSGQGEN